MGAMKLAGNFFVNAGRERVKYTSIPPLCAGLKRTWLTQETTTGPAFHLEARTVFEDILMKALKDIL